MTHFDKCTSQLLRKLYNRKISVKSAYKHLKTLPYSDMGFACLDHHRAIRKGFAEVVYCEGKKHEQVKKILLSLLTRNDHILLTRASPELYEFLKKGLKKINYNDAARIIYYKKKPLKHKKEILVLTAGTSDMPVAEEARLTAEVMGNRVRAIYDVGVAGIHRLFDKLGYIRRANVIIVVAGMEGALASVVSGLTNKPVIAVPTSVGYGSSLKGIAALLTMLNACSPGISVVNIDNGFGAGYFASLINK